MEKVDPKQFDDVYTHRNPVIREILNLNVGEVLKVEKEDWTMMSSISQFASNVCRRKGIKIKTRQLVDGYLVKRIS